MVEDGAGGEVLELGGAAGAVEVFVDVVGAFVGGGGGCGGFVGFGGGGGVCGG